MFHPLLEDPGTLKDQDLDAKILDLSKKYGIAARMGQGGACQQIVIALDTYKAEQQRRQAKGMADMMKKQNGNLDDLINID
jgi:hypothetical protein